MPLYLQSLEKAIKSLEEAVQITQDEEHFLKFDTPLCEVLKSGVIKRFTFTYEISCKAIQRWLRLNISPEASEPRSRRDLFRIAAQHALIEDPEHWFDYDVAWHESYHTYNEFSLETVFAKSVQLVVEVRFLLDVLRRNYD